MQILGRIDGGIVNPDLVVQVGPGTVTRRAYVTQDVAAANVLSGNDREPGEMGVQSLNPVAVIENYLASVSRPHAGLDYSPVSRRANGFAYAGGNVDSSMEGPLPIKRIQTGAEGTGYDSLHRPERRRVSRIHRAAQSRGKRLEKSCPCMISPDIAEERRARSWSSDWLYC